MQDVVLDVAAQLGHVHVSGAPLPITGYNIVDAETLDAAKALCDNHPFLVDASADFSVDVYELNPIQM